MLTRYFVVMLMVAGLVGSTRAEDNLQTRAKASAVGLISRIYPAAMGVYRDLRASDDQIAANEVDKMARTTADEILLSIYTAAREITTDINAAADDMENAPLKAGATEILKGLYQGAGILASFIEASRMKGEANEVRAAAEEIIKGLYRAAGPISECAREAKRASQVVSDMTM